MQLYKTPSTRLQTFWKPGLLGWLIAGIVFVLTAHSVSAQVGLFKDELPQTKMKNTKGSIHIQDQGYAISLGIPLFGPVLLLEADRMTKHLKYRNLENFTTNQGSLILPEDHPQNLYQTSQGLGVLIPILGDSLLIAGGPAILSDEKEISHEDYSFTARLLYFHDTKAPTSWTFGVIQNQAFGSTKIYPLIGFKHVEKQVTVKVNLPISLNLRWDIGQNWALLWTESLQGGAYRLTEKAPWFSEILRFSNLKSTLGIGMVISDFLVLSARVGYSNRRLFQYYDKDNKSDFHFSLRDGPLYAISISLGEMD